jgi:hypothetical protein
LERLKADVDAGAADAQEKLSQFKAERCALVHEYEAVSFALAEPDSSHTETSSAWVQHPQMARRSLLRKE